MSRGSCPGNNYEISTVFVIGEGCRPSAKERLEPHIGAVKARENGGMEDDLPLAEFNLPVTDNCGPTYVFEIERIQWSAEPE